MWRMWQHMNIHQSLCYEPLVPLGKHYLSIIIHKWTDMQYMTCWYSFHKKLCRREEEMGFEIVLLMQCRKREIKEKLKRYLRET